MRLNEQQLDQLKTNYAEMIVDSLDMDSLVTLAVESIEQNIKDCPLHKKTHVLVVCYQQFWGDLEYIKNRRGEDTYKSQEYRYSDLQ